jgi:hypothetical protein
MIGPEHGSRDVGCQTASRRIDAKKILTTTIDGGVLCWDLGRLAGQRTMAQRNDNQTELEYTTTDSRTGQAAALSQTLGQDQLDYMADMIGELHKLARDSGMETLSGLLALAQVEARRNLKALSSKF